MDTIQLRKQPKTVEELKHLSKEVKSSKIQQQHSIFYFFIGFDKKNTIFGTAKCTTKKPNK